MLGKQGPHTLNIFQLYLVSFVGWFYFSPNCVLACPMMFWNCKGLCSWINLQICFMCVDTQGQLQTPFVFALHFVFETMFFIETWTCLLVQPAEMLRFCYFHLTALGYSLTLCAWLCTWVLEIWLRPSCMCVKAFTYWSVYWSFFILCFIVLWPA